MGKLFVVGIGPGDDRYITPSARLAMDASDVLCGYTVYIDLVKELYPEKELLSTPMLKEIERCRSALELAQQGRSVSLLCSGDAGVYGMAGPVLQLLDEYNDVEVEIVPGITAASSGAAVLGAPLMHDFCVISLSDLMTPWTVIEKRLLCASEGDFCICIYNPMSKHRPDHLQKACSILLQNLPPETVCGWVRNIGRPGQEHAVLTLSELKNARLDMFTTVFIGSSGTENINGRMVTPRGYEGVQI